MGCEGAISEGGSCRGRDVMSNGGRRGEQGWVVKV